ncbi:MAG: transposase [Phycisphaerales bacterium]|nr:transposase [Phycisphaerales bacterium]
MISTQATVISTQGTLISTQDTVIRVRDARILDLEAENMAQKGVINQLTAVNRGQADQIARFKKLPKRPKVRKSLQMDKGPKSRGQKARGRRRATIPQLKNVTEVRLTITPPEDYDFNGWEQYMVQELGSFEARSTLYHRQRWATSDGSQSIMAPLPDGIQDHFGPNVHRIVVFLHYRGGMTVANLLEVLTAWGLVISKYKVVEILTDEKHAKFHGETMEVLRTALEKAGWITVDDTGARHKGKNGYTTQIGNDFFTFFRTTYSKSRSNFLEILQAGSTGYVINDDALAYMRACKLSEDVFDRLSKHPDREFVDRDAWETHLKKLDIIPGMVSGKAIKIATQAAIWGNIKACGFLKDAVIVSDDAGQFKVGAHGNCWVHSARLVKKLEAVTKDQQKAVDGVLNQIWRFYRTLGRYQKTPTESRKRYIWHRFDAIFLQETDFAALNEQLRRLYDNKADLLMVLEHPEIPLHTNASENDIRAMVMGRSLCTSLLSV